MIPTSVDRLSEDDLVEEVTKEHASVVDVFSLPRILHVVPEDVDVGLVVVVVVDGILDVVRGFGPPFDLPSGLLQVVSDLFAAAAQTVPSGGQVA